ncbi:MAG: xanthine dehydrogenase family protein molybdopterin-binding subunit [Pseudomonadota bacterium]
MSTTNSLTMDRPVTHSLLDTAVQDVIGKPLDRVEGPLKVAGTATYAAEYPVENMAFGVLVGAPFGAGTIDTVDAASVEAIPGVIAVVTDFESFAKCPVQGGETSAPMQGVKEVVYFGQPVAIVVAESFEAARDAAARLKIDYTVKEGRYDFEALKGEHDTPRPSDSTPPHFKQGKFAEAFAAAAVRVDATFTTPSQNSAAMEPHASTAFWADGQLTVFGAYQMVAQDQQSLAKALGVSAKKVRIVSRYVGGGFGSKLGIAPEAVAAAIAARQLDRPVKCVMARQQVFDATVRRSNTEQRVRLGADAHGRLTAIGHETLVSNLDGDDFFEPAGLSTHFLYAGENRLITHDIVRLNQTLSGSMRAPGEAVGMLALEGAIDELAELAGIDPIALRKRNDPECDPEKNIPYSSRNLTRCLDEGAAKFGWAQRDPRPGTRREGEWLIGTGVAAAARSHMTMQSSASVKLGADGRATVETDMTDIGTGTYTILTQIAAELLGLPVDRVTTKLGDTDLPPSAGSGGSWGAGAAGSSVYLACEALREQLAKAMEVSVEALTLKDGYATALNRRVAIADLVGDGLEATGEIKPGKQDKETTQASYGAHFAEVAVNAVSGEVRVRRFLGVFAAGRILNAKTARSQCLGGITFGIGAALSEDLVHDTRTGKIVNRDLAEYHLPVNADVPQIEVEFLEERDVHANPLQSKGIGELGISGAGAAIANAIWHATGVRVRDYPITLDKLLNGLPAL